MATENKVTKVRSVNVELDSEKRIFTFKATELIWLLFGILEVMIGLRIIFKLIAANPGSPIVGLVYSFTDLFLLPFAGMTATPSAGGMVLEISSFLAMIIYALIAWAIERVIWVVFYRPRSGAVESITQTTSSELHDDLP